jgi:hypothetical protein
MHFLVVALLLRGGEAGAVNLEDPDSIDRFVLAQRDAFERAGLWGENYDPMIWRDRRQARRLVELGAAAGVICPDGTTSCAANQICLNCRCTIFPTSQYLGGKVILANHACIWSKCSCGVAR